MYVWERKTATHEKIQQRQKLEARPLKKARTGKKEKRKRVDEEEEEEEMEED